jgi:hypothetical protein
MAVITCTHCGASGNAPDHILGQQVRCSKCKQSFVAGGSSPPPAPSPFAVEPAAEEEGFPTNEDVGRAAARRSSRRDDDIDDELRRPIRKPGGGSGFVDILMFRRMVAPYLIIILFWVMLVGVILGSLGSIGVGLTQGGRGIPFVLIGVVYLVIGPLAVRLWCEVMIVIFRINETLTDIHNEMRKDE